MEPIKIITDYFTIDKAIDIYLRLYVNSTRQAAKYNIDRLNLIIRANPSMHYGRLISYLYINNEEDLTSFVLALVCEIQSMYDASG